MSFLTACMQHPTQLKYKCTVCIKKPVQSFDPTRTNYVPPRPVSSPTNYSDYIPARRYDPDTSKIAARMVDTTKREQAVLDAFIAANRPMCNEQLIDFMQEEQTGNVSSRVTSLRRKGFLRWTGTYYESRQKRPQRVNALVPVAEREAAIRQFMVEEEEEQVS